jgi:periplasmic protein TonB
MAYAQKKELSGNRTLAIVIVVVVQFVLGYTIVTGLAYNVIKQGRRGSEDLRRGRGAASPRRAAASAARSAAAAASGGDSAADRSDQCHSAAGDPAGPGGAAAGNHSAGAAGAAAAAASAAKVVKAESARGDLQGLFSGDDYPQDALRNEQSGTTSVRLDIGTDGRVTGLHGNQFERFALAGYADLPDSQEPRAFHPGPAQQRPADDGHLHSKDYLAHPVMAAFQHFSRGK